MSTLVEKIIDNYQQQDVGILVVSDYDNSLLAQEPLPFEAIQALDKLHSHPIQLQFNNNQSKKLGEITLKPTKGTHSPRGILPKEARVEFVELQKNLRSRGGDFDILTAGDYHSVYYSINATNSSTPFSPGNLSSGYGGIINNNTLVFPPATSCEKAISNLENLKDGINEILIANNIEASLQSGCYNMVAILFDPDRCDGKILSEAVREKLHQESREDFIHIDNPGAFFLDITMTDEMGKPSTKNEGFQFIIKQWNPEPRYKKHLVVTIGDSNPDVDMFIANRTWAQEGQNRESLNIQIGSKTLRNPETVDLRLESPAELQAQIALINARLRG